MEYGFITVKPDRNGGDNPELGAIIKFGILPSTQQVDLAPSQSLSPENLLPPTQPSQTIFGGIISPTDQSTLLEFLRKNTVTAADINGRSHGTATVSIPGGFTPTKIAYNGNDFANGLTWDSTNHRFVCVKAGQYIVTAAVSYNGAAAGNQYEIAIYQNGGQIDAARQQASVGGSVLSINVTDILNLAVGDYVEAFTQHSDAGAINILNSSTYTWLTIAKI